MNDKTGNDMLKLGVLWKRTTRQGNRPFLTDPDCALFVVPDRPQGGRGS